MSIFHDDKWLLKCQVKRTQTLRGGGDFLTDQAPAQRQRNLWKHNVIEEKRLILFFAFRKINETSAHTNNKKKRSFHREKPYLGALFYAWRGLL